MRTPLVATVFTLVSAFGAHSTAAAANPAYDAGYPKTGNTVGGILLKGTINLGRGVTTTGGCLISATPVGGGLVKTKSFNTPADETGLIPWGEVEITGLTSNEAYTVIVQITVKMGGVVQTMATDPGTATAK
jgi:hypothetical protein